MAARLSKVDLAMARRVLVGMGRGNTPDQVEPMLCYVRHNEAMDKIAAILQKDPDLLYRWPSPSDTYESIGYTYNALGQLFNAAYERRSLLSSLQGGLHAVTLTPVFPEHEAQYLEWVCTKTRRLQRRYEGEITRRAAEAAAKGQHYLTVPGSHQVAIPINDVDDPEEAR